VTDSRPADARRDELRETAVGSGGDVGTTMLVYTGAIKADRQAGQRNGPATAGGCRTEKQEGQVTGIIAVVGILSGLGRDC